MVQVAGSVSVVNRAFGVDLVQYERDDVRHHGHAGSVRLPDAVARVVDGVLGLDNRPCGRSYLRPYTAKTTPRAARPRDLRHYLAPQVARIYGFPPGMDGAGECIAFVELGGGYRRSDLAAYARRANVPVPRVTSVSVDGARNRPTGDAMGDDGEVALDLEVAAAIAPRARLVVYFAPTDEQGFLRAVKAAIHDRENRPSVLSISWGNQEIWWSSSARRLLDRAFRAAARLGITVCTSVGDQGASDGVPSGVAVDFPASSPHVLGCGGTRLLAVRGRRTGERVWNDRAAGFGATGGGISTRFARPAYQKGVGVRRRGSGGAGRGVPDVAGVADPETAYRVRVDGTWLRLGGTSAVAPLWAGLIALVNQGLHRRVGFVNPILYRLQDTGAFHAITAGDNGAYWARAGWDACSGLGVPNGAGLLAALRKVLDPSPAGD